MLLVHLVGGDHHHGTVMGHWLEGLEHLQCPLHIGGPSSFRKDVSPLICTSGEGGFTGIHQGDLPGFGLLVVHLHVIGAHVEGDIAIVQEIIGKIFLDHVALVATADHKIVDAMVGIDLHDVPQHRQPADLHHRLGPQVGFFTDPGA